MKARSVIKFHCHHCNRKLGVADDCAGKRVWCPQCRVLTVVPSPGTGSKRGSNPSEQTVYSVYVCQSDPGMDVRDSGEEKPYTLFV